MVKKEVFEVEQNRDFLWFISHKIYFYFLFFLIVLLLSTFLFLFFQTTEEDEFICDDGTDYNFCSITKPYYCVNGALVEKASLCGCPEGSNENNDICVSKYHTSPKNISLKYVVNKKENEINFTVYEGLVDYLSTVPRTIDSDVGEEPSRADFKFRKLDEVNQKPFLLPLALKIKSLSEEKEEQLKIAVSLVQNIEWGHSNKTVKFAGTEIGYSRFPYEILSDSQGLCGEKSELLAFLLREIGYDVVLFYNQKENHESVGVKCPLKYSWNNSGYCFIETSGPSIITDTAISYVGGVSLEAEPQIINISEGVSLGEHLGEYGDAKTLMRIKSKIDSERIINFLDKWKLSRLNEKYGLVDEYNLE